MSQEMITPPGWLWMTHPSRNGGRPLPVQVFAEEGIKLYRPFDTGACEFEWLERDPRWQEVSAAPAQEPPQGWRERLNEIRDADYTYSQYPELARVIMDSVIDALDELESAASPPARPAAPEDRERAAREAALALVEKLDLIHANPEYQSVWILSANHGRPYAGPTYSEELAALKAALQHDAKREGE